jgi:hypothetical protein
LQPITPTTAFTALRVQRGQPAAPDTALGRLLRDPKVLAFEQMYHIPANGDPVPMADVGLWMDIAGGAEWIPILSTRNTTPWLGNPETAQAVVEAMSTDLKEIVAKADDRIGITEGGYTGNVRVLFMADGWVLADGDADTNAINLIEWVGMVEHNDADAEELQEATDGVDWPRFCLPFLPKPTSAHDALAQQAAAERMVTTALTIQRNNGVPALSRLGWTVAFERSA